MFEIIGKVALVTGGASGIGLATIEQLLNKGLKGVSIVDINESLGEQVVENLKIRYGCEKVLFVKADVANRDEFEDAFKKTVNVFHALDIVINSAGIVKDLVWEEQNTVNLGGTMTGTYFAFEKYLPQYKSGPEGVIVNLSSIAGVDVFAHNPFYSATKAGVLQLSRAYGSPPHYNRNHVRVMAVCPGFTDTPLNRVYSGRHLGPPFFDLRAQTAQKVVVQPVGHVGKTITDMIEIGRNGSVWVVSNNESPYELKFSSANDKIVR